MCGLMIICGTCGNNMCNGVCGQDGTCPGCESAARLFQEEFKEPVIYSAVRATRQHIHEWQINQLKNIPEMAGAVDSEWVIAEAINVAEAAFRDLVELERALTVSGDPL
jgi:hypothetical protein